MRAHNALDGIPLGLHATPAFCSDAQYSSQAHALLYVRCHLLTVLHAPSLYIRMQVQG